MGKSFDFHSVVEMGIYVSGHIPSFDFHYGVEMCIYVSGQIPCDTF